jgi:plastocyanin domain-containing protein
MQKSTFNGLVIFAIILIGGFMLTRGGADPGITGNVIANGVPSDGALQEIVLGMKNYNYYPDSYKVKAGQPVKISADDSVYGCFRDLVVRGTNVRKYLRTPQDSVEFTIDNPGTYTFACSMGMGSGKLIVE